MNIFRYRNLKNKNYFEGWYFRFSTNAKNYAIIFAITKNIDDPHAFIQLFDDTSKSCKYVRFSVEEFRYDDKDNKVIIGSNHLSLNDVFIDEVGFQIQLSFLSKSTLFDLDKKKSAMGYLSNFPLECFQEVIYLNGTAKGLINRVPVNGKIYIEKTYGSKFPVQWIWLQSNHGVNGSSISFSVGKIPFIRIKVKGFLCVLHVENTIYHFYSGNLSKLHIQKDKIILKKGVYSLHILPTSSNTIKLVGPAKKAKMSLDVFESLSATSEIKLFKNKVLIFEDKYTNVGYENMW